MSAKRNLPGRAVPGNRWDLLDGVVPDPLPSVSVVVAYYDQPVQLQRTLVALQRQDYPGDKVQIIVVDDGSPVAPLVPSTVRLLVQADKGFRLSAARNLGASAAQNDVLVFLDADTSPEPGYLRALTRLPGLIGDAVAVGRRRHADLTFVPVDESVELAGPEHELEQPAWLDDAYRQSRNLLDADHRSYRFLIGAVLACGREFFAQTGGFDESFTEYGGEDWEWAYRAWLTGAVFAHVPAAVAWHDGPYRVDRGPHALAEKNREALRLANLIPVPGSRGRGLLPTHADIVISGPHGETTPAQLFVSQDSIAAEVPGSVVGVPPSVAGEIFDRVRIEVRIEQPVRVRPGALAEAMAAIDEGSYSEVRVRSLSDQLLLTVISRRAQARQNRWGGEPLLPSLDLTQQGVAALTAEVDLEAYLGGWD